MCLVHVNRSWLTTMYVLSLCLWFRIDINGVIGHVCRLFQGRDDLLVGFNCFLPEGHRMPVSATEYLREQAAAAAAQQSKQPLQIGDAMSYMDRVREIFADRPDVYMQFLDIMKNFQAQR